MSATLLPLGPTISFHRAYKPTNIETVDYGDLSQLFHIQRVHEFKKRRAQSLVSMKPSIRSVFAKYSRRDKNRLGDLVNKATTLLYRGFSHCIHSS